MISNDPGEMLHVSELDDEFELFYPFMDRRLILFFRLIESRKQSRRPRARWRVSSVQIDDGFTTQPNGPFSVKLPGPLRAKSTNETMPGPRSKFHLNFASFFVAVIA